MSGKHYLFARDSRLCTVIIKLVIRLFAFLAICFSYKYFVFGAFCGRCTAVGNYVYVSARFVSYVSAQIGRQRFYISIATVWINYRIR